MTTSYLCTSFHNIINPQQRLNDNIEAHPASKTPVPNGKIQFRCNGCESTRSVVILDRPSLHRNLDSAYPYSLSTLKTSKIANQVIGMMQIHGYMCRGCSSFHKKTGLKVPITGISPAESSTSSIARMFIYQDDEFQSEELDRPSIEYLDHLRDDSRFTHVFSRTSEELESIIKDHEIQTFKELLEHLKLN